MVTIVAGGLPAGIGRWSLFSGAFPVVVDLVAIVLLGYVASRHGRRWWFVALPALAVVGVVAAWGTAAWIRSRGWATEAVPRDVEWWCGLTAVGLVAAVASWRGVRWWRRVAAVLAVPVLVLASAVSVNRWTGYLPTLGDAWHLATGGGVDEAITLERARALRGSAQPDGRIVAVDIDSRTSGFHHRTEYVWLPPAWFASRSAPPLPVVMLIGGAFAEPSDWFRVGGADATARDWARAHDGMAPVLVLPDSGGNFNTDTECVDGPNGNAATHLVDEVPRFVESTFDTATDPAHWAVAGWSTGGTCAIDIVAMHPDLAHTFLDISGDTGPNTGNPDQTLANLYGGDRALMARFDPATVLLKGAPYTGIEGVLTETVEDGQQVEYVPGPGTLPHGITAVGAADVLGPRAAAAGMSTLVSRRTMPHTWQYAQVYLAEAWPWLAGRVGTPGAPVLPVTAVAGHRHVVR